MKKLFIPFLCLLFLMACNKESSKKTKNQLLIEVSDFKEIKDVDTFNYEGLSPYLNKKDEKTYVINFWATWCAPCVKELPYFEYINQTYKDKVEVVLVSLDFPNQKEKKLIPYINKKKIRSKVIHLDDPNEQVWIANVDKDWSGAIPATLIYNKDKRKFYEQSFTKEELETQLKQFIDK